MTETEDRLVAWHGIVEPVRKRLAPEYADKSGRLVADRPSEPEKLIDPDTLVLAHYQDAEVETQAVDWEQYRSALAEATGKKVERSEYHNSADDVDAIKAGKVHVVALHAADAPYVVNHAGLVPIGVLGNEGGAHGNRLDLAVSSKSKIRSLAELRGHSLTCTTPDSITGYRAAVAVLSRGRAAAERRLLHQLVARPEEIGARRGRGRDGSRRAVGRQGAKHAQERRGAEGGFPHHLSVGGHPATDDRPAV